MWGARGSGRHRNRRKLAPGGGIGLSPTFLAGASLPWFPVLPQMALGPATAWPSLPCASAVCAGHRAGLLGPHALGLDSVCPCLPGKLARYPPHLLGELSCSPGLGPAASSAAMLYRSPILLCLPASALHLLLHPLLAGGGLCPFGPTSSRDGPRPCASRGSVCTHRTRLAGPSAHVSCSILEEPLFKRLSRVHVLASLGSTSVLLARCLLPRFQASRTIAPH